MEGLKPESRAVDRASRIVSTKQLSAASADSVGNRSQGADPSTVCSVTKVNSSFDKTFLVQSAD